MDTSKNFFQLTNSTPYSPSPWEKDAAEIEISPNPSKDRYALIPSEEKLDLLAITRKQFKYIIDFVGNMKPISERKVIKRCAENGLPFSLFCVPKEDRVFTYILFKQHVLTSIAEGSHSRVTFAWDVENQKVVTYRSAKKEEISEKEREINEKLSTRKDLFVVTSEIADYIGSYTKRIPGSVPNNDFLLEPRHKTFDSLIQKYRAQNSKGPHFPKTGMILELQERGSITFLFASKLLTPRTIFSVAKDVLKALTILHEEFKIVHLDLKPDNILLTKDFKAKIADFGHARYLGEKIRTKFTLLCIPPEILSFAGHESIESYKADFPGDIWSFGISMMIMIGTLLNNFKARERWKNVFDEMLEQDSDMPQLISDFLSSFKEAIKQNGQHEILEIFPLLEKCFEVNPQKRITARQGVELIDKLIKKI